MVGSEGSSLATAWLPAGGAKVGAPTTVRATFRSRILRLVQALVAAS